MFTGIIEATGLVKEVISSGSNKIFRIESAISQELTPDQSVSHSGACLTVEEITGNLHKVTAVDETLKKTNLGDWKEGTVVNLERCLRPDSRLDGHIVQGHVDTTGICLEKREINGSWVFEVSYPKKFAELIIEKGSVCVNGVSLTAFDIKKKSFRVTIIPYTFDHTNINKVEAGNKVNIEFDIVGKYLLRRLSLRGK